MANNAKIRRLDWYRIPIDSDLLKSLNTRSDVLGFLQAGGYLLTLIITGSLAFVALQTHPLLLIPALFLHGTVYAFQINAVHELAHGTVFKTKSLNTFFSRLFAFLGWIQDEKFNTSHVEHHRFTLHPPDDLEVVLPIKIKRIQYIKHAIINPLGIFYTIKDVWRVARGRFAGEWELKTIPESKPDKRRQLQNWAWTLLVGHALLTAVSLYFGLWLIPVLITLAPYYGGWLFFLCNNTQHVGLQDNILDFRLCCRTMTLNPIVQFLYWHMNFHTEHHMYAAVPCYKLPQLHRAIKHTLPPVKGLIGTWQEIADILAKQEADPAYLYHPPLPEEFPAPARTLPPYTERSASEAPQQAASPHP